MSFSIRLLGFGLSNFCLSVGAVFIAQWLEVFVLEWFSHNYSLLDFNLFNYLVNFIQTFFSLEITGISFADSIIKAFLGFCLLSGVLFTVSAKAQGNSIINIKKIILSVLVFPYVIYKYCFDYLGYTLGHSYFFLGVRASQCLFIPLILFFCLAKFVLIYNNLGSSIYATWIEQDKVIVSNFIDFYLYTLRASVFDLKMYDSFWQYWVALPINLIFGSAFLFTANYVAINAANRCVKSYDEKFQKIGVSYRFPRSNPIAMFLIVLFAIFALFTSFKWATDTTKLALANSSKAQKSIPAVIAPNNINTSLPSTTTLSMDGSVTMVKMMKYLREGYQQINPKIQITYGLDPNGKPSDGENIRPTGSSGGLKNLIKGSVTMAASSRPLKPDEAKAGIKLIPIARDAIAIVVGINNPFKGGLTTDQLRQIYQGQITNWSQVGGVDKPIKVYNRGAESGTKDFFKEQVLLGNAFAPDSNNFKTWERDETTAVLRVLADDGIYYASVFQAQGQELIRVVPIEGIDPLNKDTIKKKVYPLSRDLYLAIPDKTSPEVKQFIEFTRSPQGQKLVEKAEFISIL